MIDDMVVLLGKEQQADNDKKEYCEAQIDVTEDTIKELEHAIKNLEKAIADATNGIATLTDEIAALVAGVEALDKSVAEATATRKEENEDYVELMASDSEAKELLAFAKNRLNKFYNPKLYKAAPKRVLSEDERITLNMGGTLAPTEAPGGIAGTGVEAIQTQGAPPPPPATWNAYAKKSEESNGVITMIGMLEGDLDKEIQEMEFEEKDSQAEYEQYVEDSKNKRAADSKSLADKESAKADLEGTLEQLHKDIMDKMKEGMANAETLKNIHMECDWLLQNFDYRKEARAGERESLLKAKAVLSGADYSLIEVAHVRQHRQ